MREAKTKMKKRHNKKVVKKNLKSTASPPILKVGYWGDGGSTQYKYSKKELFNLTQGL